MIKYLKTQLQQLFAVHYFDDSIFDISSALEAQGVRLNSLVKITHTFCFESIEDALTTINQINSRINLYDYSIALCEDPKEPIYIKVIEKNYPSDSILENREIEFQSFAQKHKGIYEGFSINA